MQIRLYIDYLAWKSENMTIKSTWGVCYQTRYSIECICGKDFQIKGERETYSAKKEAIPKFQNLADE